MEIIGCCQGKLVDIADSGHIDEDYIDRRRVSERERERNKISIKRGRTR